MAAEKRAVVVGINNYQDKKIPPLAGAINDAEEVFQKLKELGQFKIEEHHFLINENATCQAIRKALSDLFWQPDPCKLALFYFSGHGFQDGYGSGYLAPYDIAVMEPLICGIRMQELKEVLLSSKNKDSALVLLDCCYSGLSTKGDKALAAINIEAPLDPIFKNLKGKNVGKGKIILASSQGDKRAREMPECKHKQNGKTPHAHGAFTFQFLEALDYGGADETGRITLSQLRSFVEKQLGDKGKQLPSYYAVDTSRPEHIEISVAPQIYQNFIGNTLEQAKKHYDQQDPTTLVNSAVSLVQVLEVAPKNAEARDLKKKVNETFQTYNQAINKWLFDNKVSLKSEILPVWVELELLLRELTVEKVAALDHERMTLLANLCEVSTEKLDTKTFVEQCEQFIVLRKTAEIESSVKNPEEFDIPD